MSQRHLYGESYTQMNPPRDWETAGVNLVFEPKINTSRTEFSASEFVFTNDVADWIEEYHIPTYGVFIGVRYRVESIDDFTGAITTIFDGMINLRDRSIQSKSPNIFTAPIIEFDDIPTILDQIFAYTQTVLENEGFLNASDFVDVPVIRESKKNAAERALILVGLATSTINIFTKLIQDFMSAISDILGISLPLGLVEILLLMVNAGIEILNLVNTINVHKDLFFPAIHYYKGVKLKSLITKSFDKLGYPVEFGDIDTVLSNIVLLKSQDENDGTLIEGLPSSGILNTWDQGYLIGEAMTTIQDMFNTRQEVRSGVVHIRNEFDSFWTNSPEFIPENILLDTTDQYSNGYTKENTEDLPAIVSVGYEFDDSDAHTLTNKNDDYHVVRRSSITELDPKLNLFKGLKEIKIKYAIAVRKQPLDNLFDLFMGINDEFDVRIQEFQDLLTSYVDSIPEIADVDTYLTEILAIPELELVFGDRVGALKIEDNTYALPKLIYLQDGKIPENFKDFIGATAIYNNYYLKASPADINDFGGQKVDSIDWSIPFTVANYNQVKNNPYFGEDAKFKTVNWIDDQRIAVTNSEKREIFDTNITENAE